MTHCCYHGTVKKGDCWLNGPAPPGPPSPPAPSPVLPQPTPDADGLLAFCQWGEGKVTAAQRWLVNGDGRVMTADGGHCLERLASDLLALRPCTATPGQLFETRRVNETLAQIRVPGNGSA